MRNGKVAPKPASAQPKTKAPRANAPRAAKRVGTASETAFLILDEQLNALLEEEQRIRTNADVDAVHDMRVASRRLRAGLRAFSAFLNPGIVALEPQIKWIFSLLGDVRDFDICIQLLNAQTLDGALHTVEDVAAALREARNSEFNKLREALDSSRYHELVQELRKELHKGPQSSNTLSGTPMLAAAPDIVSHEFRVMQETGQDLEPGADPVGFHKLRKRAKRFRYTLEFVKPLYKKRCKKMIDSLKDLQQMLGDRQDQIMFADRVEALAQKGRPAAELIRLTVELAEQARKRASEIEERFPSAYASVTGKPWRRLRKSMNEKRRELWT